MTIYIVTGIYQDYDDRWQWPVRAFRDEGAAIQHVQAAEGFAEDVKTQHEAAVRVGDDYDFPPSPHDPYFIRYARLEPYYDYEAIELQ